MYIYIFETLLYLSFALTGGYILLLFVPDWAKPQIKLPPDLFQYALFGIPLFSLMSIIRTVFILRDFAENLSFLQVLFIVLKDYSYGNAWVWNLIICTVMYIVFQLSDPARAGIKWTLAAAWCLSVLAHGWASHPAGFSSWGFLAQSAHVGAVSVWLGILIIVAWFTRGAWNWKAFVRWYTPFAIGCMALVTAAGIAMMFILIDGYLNAWGIAYGQALLLKHLIFVPLLLLAFMNGWLSKITRDGQHTKALRRWLRFETLLALSILIITAYMGIQEPPHEGEFKEPDPSPLFRLLHGENVQLTLDWQWSALPLGLILTGVIALSLTIASYKRENYRLFAALAFIFVSFSFLGLLMAVN